MKTLVLAMVFFGVMLAGCYDVAPFKAVKRVLRRTPSRKATGPIGTAPLPREPEYTGYAGRRRPS